MMFNHQDFCSAGGREAHPAWTERAEYYGQMNIGKSGLTLFHTCNQMLSVVLLAGVYMRTQYRLVCWFSCLPTLLGLVQQVTAQQVFMIHGLVIQAQTNGRISVVTIRDLRSNDIAMSDELGGFSIKAVAGDTLQFGKTGFAVTKLVIINPGDLVVTMGAEIA
jgi:hypothetical protein